MAATKAKSAKTFPKSAPAGKSAATITHERIEHDIAEFEKSGGKIEKLGNTPVFKKIR
ncbi:hypothetical protein GCM10027084_01010 [Pseudoxanthomonas sangjuensis]|uniref:hypothetical protein n=1 Tax=Pseudoxanthomonas sangjuensis TaxID=1503750 RepID=UPI00147826E9|nr:hypothetical protein [Pseudoxanthomonas sangjuensis]